MNRTITVTGTASAKAVPDLVTLTLGVETRRDTAAKAYDDAGKAANAVAASLRESGISAVDLRTSGLNLRADLVWVEGQGQKVNAYVASTNLQVGIRSQADAPVAIAAAVAAGGDDVRINGLEQGFADASSVLARAQEAAWQDAVARAEQYASLASASLGKVVSIAQEPLHGAPVPLGGMVRASFAAEAMPVEAGESSVSASIKVEWELL
ncbi:SIMPL domain-containing protein [Paenarthrobacter aurescens]|uniref:Putative conserved lipoprotein LpqG n=1 Tax=Paenarthrobacter aurescens TaxID=43663 RepID=A0A4Y3NDC7_PAEAU|nr:SIMPL domain-containing protein [Paenarthrobacter aurescens]MDO6143135.1 SIMPL domain-containing protein [Paenarthrobacter aurescens]MDO6146981.1 SIMPL domain-containing protein [Paenarthrobacter aurescens]MDO6158227.1 SIMPL domain-containing protein [Paenarthrobacter aurescens]MDO6162211.1 SIMPL domain-containing protein [Paenarthrobacter aurescens]GEB19702.1 putative conserved lipoprotein LpqG [Paenarthrobacter aurescens]